MKKYIVMYGSKGSYDRPIEMCIVSRSYIKEDIIKDLEELFCEEYRNSQDSKEFNELFESVGYDSEKLSDAIKGMAMELLKNNITSIETHMSTGIVVRYDENGKIKYFTTGCPQDNEYDGETWEIFEI